MMRLPGLAEEKQHLLAAVVDCLSAIPDLVAIALGGSNAAGALTAASDLDVGLYYWQQAQFSVRDIAGAARSLCGGSAPTVMDFYKWGP